MKTTQMSILFSFVFLLSLNVQAWNSAFGFKRVLPPRNLSYATANPSYTKWTTITNNSPTYQGHTATNWNISPALPAGLSLNTTTGVISGTPTSSAYSGTHTITASNAGGSTTVSMNLAVVLSGYTWLGITSSEWSTGSNWSGGVAPSASTHVAIFDNECASSCTVTISSSITARSILMKSNYTGTITQSAGVGNTINLGTNFHSSFGGIVVDAGTFVGGDANIRADYIELNGGSFTSTSAELRIGFNAAHGVNTTYGFKIENAASFSHNSGSVYFDAQTSAPTGRKCGSFTLNKIPVFYNLNIDCHDTDSDQSYDSSYIEISGSSSLMQVMNDLHFYDGWIYTGTIEFYGSNVSFDCDSAVSPNVCSGQPTDTFNTGGDASVHLSFKGLTPQTYTFQDGASGPTIEVDSSSTVSALGTGTFTIQALNVISGTFTAPSSTLQFLGRTTISYRDNNTGFAVGLLGTFSHNNGTVVLSGISGYSDTRDMFTFSIATGSVNFYNLTLDQKAFSNGTAGREQRYARIPSSTTLIIEHDYTAKNGAFAESGSGTNPVLMISGNYSRQCANFNTHDCADEDTAIDKTFDTHGTVISNDSPSDTECNGCTYTFSPGAGNTVTINGYMNLRSSTTHMTVSSGTLDIASGGGVILGGNLTNNSAITCSAGEFLLYEGTLSGTPGGGDTPSCYRTTPVDGVPAVIDWVDFSSTSSSQTFTGLDNSAKIRISVANVIGAPTMQYRANGGANGTWTTIPVATPATWTFSNGHFLEFRVTGTSLDSGTFTITNLSDSSTVVDTVTGTVP